MTTESQDLHITIGSSPSLAGVASGVDLTGDIEMVKAALLYADKVTLCSPAASALFDGLNLKGASTAERITFLRTIPSWLPNDPRLDQARVLMRQYEEAWKCRNTKDGYLFLKKFEREVNKRWEQIVDPFQKMIEESGGLEITRAMDAGVLQLHDFHSPLHRVMMDSERDAFMKEYVAVVGSSVSDRKTYPLFDDKTSNLISSGIAARVIPVSPSAVEHGKEIALAADLFAKLPVFPDATVNEILDIRRELEQSLCRFRSAMISFSNSIKNASWNREFPADAEQVFRRDVAPAILDLEEQGRSNTLGAKFLAKLSDKSFQVGSAITGSAALSALIAHMSNLPLPDVVTIAVGPLATVGGVAVSSLLDWKKENQSIQQNNLFFYYRAGVLLEDRAYEYVNQGMQSA